MSALSTPGGGGTTAQSKPASGKPKFQKLDINSLYCTNKNENSEPSSVKSQLSRKHGMQSLGKVPSARRPPANLPSLKTETGQDPNTNSVSATTTVVSTPATCTSQTITTSSSSSAIAGAAQGGWVSLPPPSSPHFRTEFPSLEASAQPSHRSTEHSAPQPSLRPQTEGSWTCGGGAGVGGGGGAPSGAAAGAGVQRPDGSPSPAAAPASTPAAQQTPAFRAILPSFLMKGSTGSGLGGLGSLGNLRESRGGSGGGGGGARNPPRPAPAATPRAVEVLTARPILRDEQISSLDDISHDAGWAQNDDIDYDQKLDFSDGESSAPNKVSNKSNNRSAVDHERIDSKIMEAGDEDQFWAEQRQKQNNEVAAAVARARQRKEEEQRRQMRDSATQNKESRDRPDRERETDRDKERQDRQERQERPERQDNREKERSDREKERQDNRDRNLQENRDRNVQDNRDRNGQDTRDRNDNRDRFERDQRERDRPRDRPDNDKQRTDTRDRNDNRDRFDRERDRERGDRDRDFRDRDRDYGRDRDSNPAFSKTYNIPPRFLKQQQNKQQDGRQQDEQHKPWAFTGKPAPRRQDQPTYSAPRHAAQQHSGRRSYSRDYSDREDEFRREKDGSGSQWRSEMQEYERPKELDRSNSKESYKEFDHKEKHNEPDRKSAESTVEQSSSRTAADKLAEVFERKSRNLTEPFASSDSSIQTQPPERRTTPPSNVSQRESLERDFGNTSWADIAQDEPANYTILKPSSNKSNPPKEVEPAPKEVSPKPEQREEAQRGSQQSFPPAQQQIAPDSSAQHQIHKTYSQNFAHNQHSTQANSYLNISSQLTPSSQTHTSFTENISISKTQSEPLSKSNNQTANISGTQIQKQPSSEHIPSQHITKPLFSSQKSEKEVSESESIASKSSADPTSVAINKVSEKIKPGESLHVAIDLHKRPDDKKNEMFNNEQTNNRVVTVVTKEPVERKSSGSGSEKKVRGYGGSGGGGGGGSYGVYVRGWARDGGGRRAHRSSRSNHRASESDGSTDGAPPVERKERRRAPRSPRPPKKQEDSARPSDPAAPHLAGMENREPFAPRGQPSRRGRGGFQGTARPPAPAKRVTGYGPPNTKSPFSQANRAVKDSEDVSQQGDEKGKPGSKSRTGSLAGRGRDRRARVPGATQSGEDDNWETTSEHSEGGTTRRRSVGGRQGAGQKGPGRHQPASARHHSSRGHPAKKDGAGDNKSADVTEAMGDLKISSNKKDDEAIDDGFQEVRNKKNTKDIRGSSKEDNQHASKQPRSHSNQGGGRNGSSTRNSSDKGNARGSAPVPGKSAPAFDRPRQPNLAPRFVKQRQKQQMGLGFGPDTGAAPPPPPVNAWDKPISQSLRANADPEPEPADKPALPSQRSSPPSAAPAPAPQPEPRPAPQTCAPAPDKSGVLDGSTPPVETIIFENTNYKTAPPAEALKPKYQPGANTAKPQNEEVTAETDARPLPFNGEVRARPRTIQELIGDGARPADTDASLPTLQMAFETPKPEDSSDMKLDFAFDSDLGQLTEDKTAKSLGVGLPRSTHMSTSSTISPLAADLNLKIASVKKVWEMPAVAEGGEELQFAGFEESGVETGAPPNVCKVKPTQQLQSPPPQHYNHMGYQGGYGGLSVPSPPAVLFNSSQQLHGLGSSQQLPAQGNLYGAFLEQSRGQFGGFPGTPYGAGSAAPYNYQPPPDMFQSLPSQYRMAAAAAAGGGAAFGQSGQLGNSPNTVLISSSSNSLMSATVKPSSQQIGAIGSKGGGVGGVGGVNTYGQQYLGYSGPVGESPYSLPGLLPRPAPPASSYYSHYQPPTAPAPTYPLQFTPPAQSGAFGSQYLSSQLQVAAAVQQMQQYRAPMQQQYAPPPARPPPQQMKSPLHEHANGFAPLDGSSPTPKGGVSVGGGNKPKAAHSPPAHHKYHAPPPSHTPHTQLQHPPPPHHLHPHHNQQQMMGGGNSGRMGGGGGNGGAGGGRQAMVAPRYPAPIQRPLAPAQPPPHYRPQHRHPPPQRHNMYYHHHQRNGAGGGERAAESGDGPAQESEGADGTSVPAGDAPPAPIAPQEVKAE